MGEMAAVISETEAALIQHERWATAVEARLAKSGQLDAREERPPAGSTCNDIHIQVLTFHRHPAEFVAALIDSDLGCELAARGVNMRPDWAQGAKVMMEGLTPDALSAAGVDPSTLRAWNVVALKSDEPRILAAIASLPYRSRPRVRRAASQSIVLKHARPSESSAECGNPSEAEAEENADTPETPLEGLISAIEVSIRRTFVHFEESASISPRTAATR